MPLIFVISGASTFYALGWSRPGKFLKDRALRLLIPLVVGMLTHVAFQVYLERVSFSGFKGSFFDFYPQYFKGWYFFGGNFAWMGLHLWYLEALFVLTLICLPLFVWAQCRSGVTWFAKSFGRLFSFGGAIYLLAAPQMILIAVLDPRTFWGQRGFGGWPLIIYAFYFVYGFELVARPEIEERIEKLRWASLIGATVLFLSLLAVWRLGGDPKYGTLRYGVLLPLFALCSWCFILAILGAGRKWLGFSNGFVRYSNEAVLPFYVLHQTIILGIGYLIVQSRIPDLVKFASIAASSFLLITTIYEFGIRRNNILRLLFGMKMVKPSNKAASGATSATGRVILSPASHADSTHSLHSP